MAAWLQTGAPWVTKMDPFGSSKWNPLGDRHGRLDANWNPLGDQNGSILGDQNETLG
jgi:hypothetical protein